jgi:hypothetical protein
VSTRYSTFAKRATSPKAFWLSAALVVCAAVVVRLMQDLHRDSNPPPTPSSSGVEPRLPEEPADIKHTRMVIESHTSTEGQGSETREVNAQGDSSSASDASSRWDAALDKDIVHVLAARGLTPLAPGVAADVNAASEAFQSADREYDAAISATRGLMLSHHITIKEGADLYVEHESSRRRARASALERLTEALDRMKKK